MHANMNQLWTDEFDNIEEYFAKNTLTLNLTTPGQYINIL